jgi:hypothetical protein
MRDEEKEPLEEKTSDMAEDEEAAGESEDDEDDL